MLKKQEKRYRRHKRARAKISGTAGMPRLCVFRSNQHIYAQLIDDQSNKVLAQASDSEIKKTQKTTKATKTTREEKAALSGKCLKAFETGKIIAQKAKEKKIEKAVFDRGGYKYHGRVKALAEGARSEGLKF